MFSDIPSGHPAIVRPSVVHPCNTYFARCDISVLSGGISTKLGTNIYRASGHCWKGFQGQRSKVKVMTRPNAIMAEAYISTVWRRGSLVYV